MENRSNVDFSSEYHKRIIAFHILGMHKWQACRAALFYFDNSQYELATRMAQRLTDNPDLTSDFLRRFPISTARLSRITDALLRDSLPNYRSFGLKPKMVRELPTSTIRFAE